MIWELLLNIGGDNQIIMIWEDINRGVDKHGSWLSKNNYMGVVIYGSW